MTNQGIMANYEKVDLPIFCQQSAVATHELSIQKMPLCCMLVVVEKFFDYTLYGGLEAGSFIIGKILSSLRESLPEDVRVGSVGTDKFAIFAESWGEKKAASYKNKILKTIENIILPFDLPDYLYSIKTEFVESFSPPVPERYLLQSAVLRHSEKHCPLKNLDFQMPADENQVFDILSARNYHLWQAAKKTVALADQFSEVMNLSVYDTKCLHQAALWENVGLVKLPMTVILKPTPLTLTEKQIMESHVKISCQMAEASGVDDEVIKIIAMHHESVNGGGYPNHIGGEYLPKRAQFLHLINDYVDLQMDYPWRQSLHPLSALRTLSRSVGKKYETGVYEKFCNAVSELNFS
ncbi:MAG: HD-GYP domain-containing protein [Bacillota bacterium]|jgi:HD-GYP domain-containing protein (c-di-GMP phosphodiesterase class II)